MKHVNYRKGSPSTPNEVPVTQLAFSESKNVTKAISSACAILSPGVLLELGSFSSQAKPLRLGQWIDRYLCIIARTRERGTGERVERKKYAMRKKQDQGLKRMVKGQCGETDREVDK